MHADSYVLEGTRQVCLICYAFVLEEGILLVALLVCGTHKRGYVWELSGGVDGTARQDCIFLFIVQSHG